MTKVNYNSKDYFEKFGFKPPSEYMDFYDMCATIRKHGMKPLSSLVRTGTISGMSFE